MAVFDTNIMIDYLNGSKKAADIVDKTPGFRADRDSLNNRLRAREGHRRC